MKHKLKALDDSLKILTILIAIILVFLALTGQFRFDDQSYPDGFGIYYSALSGLPAYLNPLWQTILFIEAIALLLLPVALFILRKKLKLPVMPWIITPIIAILGIVVFQPLLRHALDLDDLVSSIFTWFAYNELIILASVSVGQCFYYYLVRNGFKAK